MTGNSLIVMVMLPIAIGFVALIAGALCSVAGPGVRNLAWNAALICSAIAPFVYAIGPRLPLGIRADFLPPGLRSASVSASADVGSTTSLDQHSPRVLPDSVPLDNSRAAPEALILIVWLAGGIFFALRFGAHVRSARRVIQSATPISDGATAAIFDQATRALGYKGRLRVLRSRDIDIPVAAGILSPTILLPAAAADWDDGDLRIVVLHELAHLKRGDVVARALSMAACTLHWFNPMVWLLSNLAAHDAELAADDAVLNVGIRPSRYAETLLSVVESITRNPMAEPAMSFANRSRLPQRIHSILRETAPRREVKTATRWIVCVTACAIAVLAACVQVVPTAAAAPASVAPTLVVSPTRVSTPTSEPAAPPSRDVVSPPKVTALRLDKARNSGWIADATRQLVVTLDDASPQVRGEAARALGRLGAKTATHQLEKLLADPDKFVRYEAQQALEILASANGGGE